MDQVQVSSLEDDAIGFDSKEAVNGAANEITITNHGYTDGDTVYYVTDGVTSMGGLTEFDMYYVKVINDDTIQLTTGGGTVINIPPTADSATHSLNDMVYYAFLMVQTM